MERAHRQLAASSAYYRDQATKAKSDLEAMSSEDRLAYGAAHVNRMTADIDTWTRMADEIDSYLAAIYPESVPVDEHQEGLF